MQFFNLLSTSDYFTCEKIVLEKINCRLDRLLAKRIVEKIYRNEKLTATQKKKLIDILQSNYSLLSDQIEKTYQFLQFFIPITERIKENISSLIVKVFSGSMTVFYYCLGAYVFDHPNIIETAKQILIEVAKKNLNDDIGIIGYNLSVDLESIYLKSKKWIDNAYKEAIKYGAIIEKYDAISFNSEYIEQIKLIDGIPYVKLKILHPDFEYGLQCGVLYHNLIVKKRIEEEDTGIIESFYKCIICRYSFLLDNDEEKKEVIFNLLKSQFSIRNTTDIFYFLTGNFQSFILSILSYIYTRFLILYFFTNKTMELINKKDIKKNMLGGNLIDDKQFEDYYNLIVSDNAFNRHYLVIGDKIVLGRWQFDLDLSIVEIAKKITLNAKGKSEIGSNVNYFGKEVYEHLIRRILKDQGWAVVPFPIKMKEGKRIRTDVDLIAYNKGIVLIGQIKLANSGRSRYEIWKAKQSVDEALAQVNYSYQRLKSDSCLLYSILKKNDICQQKRQIEKIIPIVITSSNYFLGVQNHTQIPVVSWDIFDQIIKSTNHYNTLMDLDGYFKNILLLYNCGVEKKIINSEIKCKEYIIEYEEFNTFN
ncbi:MAG: hypothetical protein IJ735_05175 [Clostridia bacterium]|nr:hypothetical protein [Clostridia bacterium]